MESIFIKGTKRTPEIVFKINGFLAINGTSIPEDANEFYKSTIDWLENYKKLDPENINFKLNFVYMNTTSTSIILKILKKIFTICENTKNIKIIWTYEKGDDDMYQQGKILEKLVGHSFIFEEKTLLST